MLQKRKYPTEEEEQIKKKKDEENEQEKGSSSLVIRNEPSSAMASLPGSTAAAIDPREFIFINVGQAGTQIGSTYWKLFCLEHGIQPDGLMADNKTSNSGKSLFIETQDGKHVPRTVFVDLERTAIDDIRTGPYGNLLHEQLISGNGEPADVYIRGYDDVQNLVDRVIERTRWVADRSPRLDGLFIFHSLGGGTGSGFNSLLMQSLSEDYGKKFKIEFALLPSLNKLTPVMEIYNSILANYITMEHSECAITITNEALFDICNFKMGIKAPTYTNFNVLIGQVVSSVATTVHCDSSNVNLNKLVTSLVPHPHLKFLVPSYAPIISSKINTQHLASVASTAAATHGEGFRNATVAPNAAATHAEGSKNVTVGPTAAAATHAEGFNVTAAPTAAATHAEGFKNVSMKEVVMNLTLQPRPSYPVPSYAPTGGPLSVANITEDCYRSCNQMIKRCHDTWYLTSCLLYRGDVPPWDVNLAVSKIKSSLKFVSWLPVTLKLGIFGQPPTMVPGGDLAQVPRSLCTLSNCTDIGVNWDNLRVMFDRMYTQRLYLHWYLREGMEESDFLQAREDIDSVVKLYRNI
ncbi:tubulin alpha chain-like [Festucalex cinctus]